MLPSFDPPLSILHHLVLVLLFPIIPHKPVTCVPGSNTQGLVRDLRLREKTIRQLEAKNATLAAKSTTPDTAQAGKPANDNQPAVVPTRRVSSEDDSEAKQADSVLHESRTSGVNRQNTGVLDAQENGVYGVEAPSPHPTSFGQSSTTADSPAASSARPARKQLTPQASETPGRVTTISYPRGGTRATFTPLSAPETAPAMGKVSDSMTPLREADAQIMDERTASPVFAQKGKVPNDLGSRARRNEYDDKESATYEVQLRPWQQPSRKTTLDRRHSTEDSRQSSCPPSEEVFPNGYPTTPTVRMPDADVTVETTVGNAKDIGGDGGGERGDDGLVHSKGRESAESLNSSTGLEDQGRGTGAPDPSPACPPAKAANDEPDCRKPLPNSGQVEGLEHEVKPGLGVDFGSPVPPRLDEMGTESETPVFRSRLVDGVPVLKYGGGRGKPKRKVLWVTSDLSEIFYTQTGR